MSEKSEPTVSPLSGILESEGESVDVQIYENGYGKWILEVVDKYKTSTVWEDLFDTDQAALDEVHDTIKTDGIQCLIVPPYDV